MEDDIGLRVCDSEGHRGTIRYVGSVEGTQGVWYGIDWDSETRGKHDGSHNGVKYFWTHSTTSGSFMRRDKLNFGSSFMEALHRKYVETDNELTVRENVEEVKASINAPFLELVGFDQVHEEQNTNKLPIPNDTSGVMEQIFPQGHIHTLTLGNMGYIWADILKLLANFPVTCLKLPSNRITTLDSVPGMFSSLEELYLQENNIVDWGEVNALGSLPNLKYLNLASTNLRNIKLNKEGHYHEELLVLWDHISQLYYLPKLSSLRFTKNPILAEERVVSSREKTIARLGGLKLLNGSAIERQERQGSEYDYIKEFGAVWLDENRRGEFLEANPRYEYLVKLHGPPLKEESAPVKSRDIIQITFQSDGQTVKKKLPITLTTAKLVNFVQRMFRNSGNPSMFYTSEKNPSQRIELNSESLQEIGFYNLTEGDTIHVTFDD
ncbi:tubulin-specific chaperone E-like [Diaphorina citri]|uniref:Tubulin-specific chaperone E n=1 Tax=Diaphorina citri TaxID=121845 RepID=A0A3Q0IMA9_DIACI|nr:tubulin-specific chaperone E-like [Diaphorina citri]